MPRSALSGHWGKVTLALRFQNSKLTDWCSGETMVVNCIGNAVHDFWHCKADYYLRLWRFELYQNWYEKLAYSTALPTTYYIIPCSSFTTISVINLGEFVWLRWWILPVVSCYWNPCIPVRKLSFQVPFAGLYLAHAKANPKPRQDSYDRAQLFEGWTMLCTPDKSLSNG